MKQYCLDSNVLIEAWNKHYSMDLSPQYWDFLDHLAHQKTVFCTREVKREIDKIDDGLSAWAKQRPYLFRDETDDVFRCVKAIFEQSENRRLVDSCGFRSAADPFVIAHAMSENATVVTKEAFEMNRTKRLKIPNVCHSLNVRCIDEFAFLREIGLHFNIHFDKKE